MRTRRGQLVMPVLGFCPERVASLRRHVEVARDELEGLISTDPAAADALRAVALAAHNLHTSWRPLLERIVSSETLTRHRSIAPAGWAGGWTPPTFSPVFVQTLVHAVLLEMLQQRGGPMWIDLHVDAEPADDPWLDDLAAAIQRAVAADPAFRSTLLEMVAVEPRLGWFLAAADLDAPLRADLLIALLSSADLAYSFELAPLADAANSLMEGLHDEPGEALRVLCDPVALAHLAGWWELDQEIVADFTHRALTVAVHEDPSLHPHGIEVVAGLVDLAHTDRFDHEGFTPGMSVAIASAIGAYLPSFVDTVRLETGVVAARSTGPDGELDVELGSYEEMVDFFEAVLRDDPAARQVLGAELAIMMQLAVSADDPATPVRVDTVAELAELLQHAVANELKEDELAAAARRAGMLNTKTLVTFTTAALFLVTGSGHPIARLLIDRGIGDIVEISSRRAPRRPDETVDLAKAAHHVVLVATARNLVDDPARRAPLGIGGSGADWEEIEDLLSDLEDLAADGVESAELEIGVYQLEVNLREIGGGEHLDELLRRPAVHDLTSAATHD